MANFSQSVREMLSDRAGIDAGRHAGGVKRRGAVAGLAVPLAELEDRKLADLLDDAGLGDVGGNARGALHHVAAADDLADPLRALHAVLEGENGRALGDQRRKALRRALRVAHLHGEDDGVGRRYFARIRNHFDGLQMQVADLAVEAQAVGLHRLQMRAARHERHVVAGGGQPRAEVAPDAAGTHNCDFHGCCLRA